MTYQARIRIAVATGRLTIKETKSVVVIYYDHRELKSYAHRGYLHVSLPGFRNDRYKCNVRIHHVVWIFHYGVFNQEKWTVAHIDGDRTNNRIGNLQLIDKGEARKVRIESRSVSCHSVIKEMISSGLIVRDEDGSIYRMKRIRLSGLLLHGKRYYQFLVHNRTVTISNKKLEELFNETP